MRRNLNWRDRELLRSLAALLLGMAGATGTSGCYSESCAEGFLCESPPPQPGPCDGDPAMAPALDECGVFVSEQGDDESPGIKGAPVKTLQHAIGLAAHGRSHGEAPTRRVYACGGEFAEAISLSQGVDLWGGRLCAGGDWSYGGPLDGPNALTVIAPPVGIPVRVLGGDDAVIAGDDATSVIFGVRAVAADASASDGKSSIAMILEHGARAIVQASVILAGDGKEGEPGEDAPSFRANAGVLGNDGADACTASMAPGALPVVTVCDDGIESTGGEGGDGGRETGGDGTSGLPEPVGTPDNRGLAGSGASSMPWCNPGQRGADGAPAERAAGAVDPGLLGIDGWIGVRGKDGKPGGVGQGGGGGGGGKGRDDMNACPADRPQGGAAGGSGGSGGCGGKGGKGGNYGGASIGIVALQGSYLTVDASTVLGAKGGNGGIGGTAQWGGVGAPAGRGGRGLLFDASRGCPGGDGGHGGRGGDAGGGLGGHSLGIGSVGASVAILETSTVSPGQAGTGGRGGNAPAESGLGQGREGTAAFWYRFDAPDPEPPR